MRGWQVKINVETLSHIMSTCGALQTQPNRVESSGISERRKKTCFLNLLYSEYVVVVVVFLYKNERLIRRLDLRRSRCSWFLLLREKVLLHSQLYRIRVRLYCWVCQVCRSWPATHANHDSASWDRCKMKRREASWASKSGKQTLKCFLLHADIIPTLILARLTDNKTFNLSFWLLPLLSFFSIDWLPWGENYYAEMSNFFLFTVFKTYSSAWTIVFYVPYFEKLTSSDSCSC